MTQAATPPAQRPTNRMKSASSMVLAASGVGAWAAIRLRGCVVRGSVGDLGRMREPVEDIYRSLGAFGFRV